MNNRNKKKSILIGSNQIIKNIEPLIAKKIKQKLKIKTIFIPKTKEDVIYLQKKL